MRVVGEEAEPLPVARLGQLVNEREDDLFLARLKLLIVMIKASLQDCPVGRCRRATISRNAALVARETVDWRGYCANFRSDYNAIDGRDLDHVFYQRVKLLTVMAGAIAAGNPIGHHRKIAILDNIRELCTLLQFDTRVQQMPFLKVA